MKYKEKILKLRAEGKSYNQIAQTLGISKGTIAYHCSPSCNAKAKARQKKNKDNKHPYAKKYFNYIGPSSYFKHKTKIYYYKLWIKEAGFTYQDIIDKFGNTPLCYLCGTQINALEPTTYVFDHKIPRKQNGPSTLDNLGIACTICNKTKDALTPDQYIEQCKKIVRYNGQLES